MPKGILTVIFTLVFCWVRSSQAITFSFDTEEDLTGWRRGGWALRGGGTYYGMRIENGILVLPLKEYLKYTGERKEVILLSPRLEWDTALFDRCIVRLRISDGASIGGVGLEWRTDETPWDFFYYSEEYRIGVSKQVFTEEWAEYEIAGFAEMKGWAGILERFSLSVYFGGIGEPHPHIPDAVLMDWIMLTGAGEELQGEPELPDVGTASVPFLKLDTLYPLGHSASDMRALDIDGDGDGDLLSQGHVGEDQFLTILLNKGDGTFESHQQSLDAELGRPVPSGDLDGDGDVDFIAPRSSIQDQIGVLLNDGAGGFVRWGFYEIGPYPGAGSAGDLDGDGDLDLVINCWGPRPSPGLREMDRDEDPLVVLFNDGDGQFGRHVGYTGGQHPGTPVLRDLDLDGDLDVAVPAQGPLDLLPQGPSPDFIYVLENDGTGQLVDRQSYQVGESPTELFVEDLDGDGWPDIVVGSGQNDHRVSLLFGAGGGQFEEAVHYEVGYMPQGLGTGDLDGDGDIDVVVSVRADVRLSFLMNQGDRVFARLYNLPISGRPSGSLVVEDLDGDGDPDIAAAGEYGPGLGAVNVFRNTVLTTGIKDVEMWFRAEEQQSFVSRSAVLKQNVPNPFNAAARIPFDLAFSGKVTLSVYDVLGRKVRTLVHRAMSPGHYSIPWDGRDDLGHPVASGQYIYRLQAGTFNDSKTMTLGK